MWRTLMEKDDVTLINCVLSGDDSAFSELVYRYQKSVHALAWRKIGDFQIAEEIAQDTFLQAYKKLATLKTPTQFAGWLYVIASNLCTDWKRRKKPIMKSLEADESATLDKTSYEMYVEEQREKKAAEHRRELVKNLLDKLPESERTVVTLHYLGEMTSEAISKFLGVSVNTIKSRLRRARKRLQKEEPMIRETLGNVKLPTNFVENIMKKIEKTTPTPTTNNQPLIPWAAIGSAALLIILLMGVSSPYISSFQQPYSFESQSETAIEIVDTPVVLDIQTKPELQKRNGSNVIARKNDGVSQKSVDNAVVADNNADPSLVAIRQNQWTQAQGPQGGDVNEIFLTSNNDLLAVTPTGIYKLTKDKSRWILINKILPFGYLSKTPIAEHNNTLYIATYTDIFASTDSGKNWTSISRRQEGEPIALLTTNEGFYLVLEEGVYISVDEGRQWSLFNIDLKDSEITAAINIEDTVLIGTEQGLYRIKSGKWKQVLQGKFTTANSLTVADNTLYAGTSPKSYKVSTDNLEIKQGNEMLPNEPSKRWELYSSNDFGETWKKITPKNKSEKEKKVPFDIRILASDKTILAIGLHIYRSRDKGQTWTQLSSTTTRLNLDIEDVVVVNENTFYANVDSSPGIHHTIDGGKSWHPFMNGIIGTDIRELVSFENRLYAHRYDAVLKSDDNGETWTSVSVVSNDDNAFRYNTPMLTIDNRTLYAIAGNYSKRPIICRLSDSGDELIPIQEIPAIENVSFKDVGKENTDTLSMPDETTDLQQKMQKLKDLLNLHDITSMTISGKTFYAVYNSRLLKWKPGLSKWVDTGVDTGTEINSLGFILAASGKTVYVGRKDGRLFQSLNEGEKWTDITTKLPIQFEDFDDIAFNDSTVFIATDKGVLTSHTGKQWRVIKKRNGKNINIRRLTVERNKVFGAHHSGIYIYNVDGEWEKISPEIPGDSVNKFVVHNDKLFIATFHSGMFHIPVK